MSCAFALLSTFVLFVLLSTIVMGDILFTTIEKWQGQQSWGRVLDAGTGAHSLKWLLTLSTDSVTAITADEAMKRIIESDSEIRLRSVDKVLVGNWMSDSFCTSLATDDGKFDTIIADYLIGAVDGFSPYCQEIVLEKLDLFRILIIGCSPYYEYYMLLSLGLRTSYYPVGNYILWEWSLSLTTLSHLPMSSQKW